MFDWIDLEIDCPECGAKVNGFQSKDGPCELLRLKPQDVWCLYDECESCGAWITFRRIPSRNDILPGYEMEVKWRKV